MRPQNKNETKVKVTFSTICLFLGRFMIPSTPFMVFEDLRFAPHQKAPDHQRVAGWKSSKTPKFFQDDWFVDHLGTGREKLPIFTMKSDSPWFCNRWITLNPQLYWMANCSANIHCFNLCPKWGGSCCPEPCSLPQKPVLEGKFSRKYVQ